MSTGTLPTDPLTAALARAVGSPAEASADGTSARSHSLPDLIAMHKYLSGLAAASSPSRGLRFNAVVPGGAVRARPYGYPTGDGYLWGYGFDRWRWTR